MSKMLRFSSEEALNAVRKVNPRTVQAPASTAPSQPVHAQSAKARMQALGRKKPGVMNKTEARFAEEWIGPRFVAGEIVWWAFEAITLKIAPDCRITVDFFLMWADGRLEAYDVKGKLTLVEDDALVKMKVAADKFPWAFYLTAPRPKKEGNTGWEVKQI